MICHYGKCNEKIEVGEAQVQVPTAGNSYHYLFFHPGCFTEWNEQQQKQETRLNNVRRLAGYTH